MVSMWVKPGLSGEVGDDDIVYLSDGRTFDLSNVAGNGFNANRLTKINEAIRVAISFIQPLSDLPSDDPDKTVDPDRATLFWSDSEGNPDAAGAFLCSRPTDVWLTYDGSSLIPHTRERR